MGRMAGDQSKGGKGDSKGGKDFSSASRAPREAAGAPKGQDPKQVFVAGIGDMEEQSLQDMFEDVGEVTRLKLLTHPDGSSKGVCFVTFSTEEQAQEALNLNGTMVEG